MSLSWKMILHAGWPFVVVLLSVHPVLRFILFEFGDFGGCRDPDLLRSEKGTRGRISVRHGGWDTVDLFLVSLG